MLPPVTSVIGCVGMTFVSVGGLFHVVCRGLASSIALLLLFRRQYVEH